MARPSYFGSTVYSISSSDLRNRLDPLVELAHLVMGKCVVQREHGLGMFYFFEFIERRSADALGGRIGKDVTVFFLEFFQPPEQTVIFRIRDDRSVKNMVAVIMLVDFLDETFRFSFDVSGMFSMMSYRLRWFIIIARHARADITTSASPLSSS